MKRSKDTAQLAAVLRKAVALKLADHSHDDGTRIFPSVATIAAQTEISERAVQRVIASLIDQGIIRLVRAGGGKTTNEYAFNLATLMGLPLTIDRCPPVTGVPGAQKAPLTGVPPVTRTFKKNHQREAR